MNSANENDAHFVWATEFENLITPLEGGPYITKAVFLATTSEPTLSLLLSIFRLFKDSNTKQALYYVLNLSAASVEQYKVPDKQLRILTWI